MIFRIYHETLGGHVHMRVFAGKSEGALGKCGDLCMRVGEFEAFVTLNVGLIEFRPEDKGESAKPKRGSLAGRSKGGLTTAARLTAEQRSEAARKAALARWRAA